MRRFFLALAALTFALSACELRAEFAINEDGSGTVGMIFAVEPEMRQLFDQSGLGGDPFADLRSDLADDPVAWDVAEFTEGRLTGIHATFPFASIDDLLDKMEALDSDEGSDAAIKDFTIARQAGGWVFEGRASDPQEQLADGSIPIPLDQLATLLKVQFRVTLPGRAAKHNADEVSSGGGKTTFIWKPDLKSKGVELRAATTPGGMTSPIVPIVFALAALVAVAVTWLRRVSAPAAGSDFSLSSDVVEEVVGIQPDADEALGDPRKDASLTS